ncbi:ATP-dependent helicase HrpB [Paenibacillus lentus]|uniref:ATP-dependent helicase HrpB n=1 Tax=Paenibacillus lentus TaxID=1338368 RepID=A0A3Q8SCT7_9BACL|nr:ATP-dependent helicase HrpB [Paenibacillus lentus]AZK47683.1 ATP-dependent helicase HrpB [Paenibacillus lentus]
MTRLPIDEVIPDLKTRLESANAAILLAEPGAGKTTRTPLELLQEPWLKGQGIVMLEPRRLAARSAAVYMAQQLGERVGETVGYRIRTESKVSSRTRITVVTEGILTRMLQHDPALVGIGLIIFDEYHERNLHADIGLALALQSQELLRDDLRPLIMSATLNAEPLVELLGGAAVIRSQGRAYPVETRYADAPAGAAPLEQRVTRAVRGALERHEGSLLVFLPGAKEIRRVERSLVPVVPSDVLVAPLYGALPAQQQQRAIAAAPPGKRKVVLATSIAESSLTIEGVTVVIDSGLRRTALFSARTGMSRLVTVRAARDSADQRRGRAGRTAPGVCYRLWSEAEDRLLPERTAPEMLEADLTPLALELAAWGASSPEELAWLDPPPAGPYRQAVRLLQQLGALDGEERITEHGRRMAELGLHPRLAHMLLKAAELGIERLACLLAALLEERDLLRGSAAVREDCDIRNRLSLLMNSEGTLHENGNPDHQVEDRDIQRILTMSRQYERRLGIEQRASSEASVGPGEDKWHLACGILISFAYPDRIAGRRADGRYILRNGRGAAFARKQHLSEASYLAIAEVDDEGTEGRILLAAPVKLADLTKHYSEHIKEERVSEWDEEAGTVRVRLRETLGAIVIKERPVQPVAEDFAQAILHAVTSQGVHILPWNDKARQLQARVLFLRRQNERWPDWSDAALADRAEVWLAPYIANFRKRSDLQTLSLLTILENELGWELRQELNAEAPTHLIVPSGSKILIHYDQGDVPYAAVRLQEVFGMMDTPRIGYGKVALIMHLLSPAGRPVQVTADLRSFWDNTYFEVKKDLKGRYPKHYWPDDPLQATATRRVRPK